MPLSAQKIVSFDDHEAPVYALEHYGDYSFFAGGGDRIVSLLDLREEVRTTGLVNTGSTIYSLKYISHRGILLAGVSGGGMHVIDLNAKKEIHFLVNHEKGVFRIVHSSKHNLIVTTGGDGKISFLSAGNFRHISTENLCLEKVRAAAIDNEEKNLAVGCGDGSIRIFDLVTLKEIHRIPTQHQSVNALCYHPYLNVLLSGGRDAHLCIWGSNDFTQIDSIPAHNYAIYSIVFDPGSSLFATASRDKTIKIWDGESFDFKLRIDKEKFDGHVFSVNTLLWVEKGIISGSDDRKIYCWKISK